jgi:chromosome segregation ATPase
MGNNDSNRALYLKQQTIAKNDVSDASGKLSALSGVADNLRTAKTSCQAEISRLRVKSGEIATDASKLKQDKQSINDMATQLKTKIEKDKKEMDDVVEAGDALVDYLNYQIQVIGEKEVELQGAIDAGNNILSRLAYLLSH